MYSGSFLDWIEMAERDKEPSKPSNDAAVLAEVIVTAAGMFDTDGVARLLCDLTDTRKAVARLAERNAELMSLSDRLTAAIDAEREDYARILANRDETITRRNQEITALRDLLDTCREDVSFWKKQANDLANRMKAGIVPILVGDPLVAAARVYHFYPGYEHVYRKIAAIKELRQLTGLGLAESKKAVEQVIEIMEIAVQATKETTDD